MIVPQQEAIIIVDNGNGPTKGHQKNVLVVGKLSYNHYKKKGSMATFLKRGYMSKKHSYSL